MFRTALSSLVLFGILMFCTSNADEVVDLPLTGAMKAVLKAHFDVSSLNAQLKTFIEKEIQNGVEAAMRNAMEKLVAEGMEEANATIVSTIEERVTDASYGVTYIRWGRKDCPAGADVVYSGNAGGNSYNNKGGGVNYLCLPNDPENGNKQSFDNDQIFGSEYEISEGRKPYGWSSTDLKQKEVPCAVCRKSGKSTVVMIPGRKTCYSDWNAEYNGYLMSSHKNHQRTDFTCVDINAEPCDSRSSNENGALFYPIRTKCGSLRCPPYTDEADLLCVVCTN
ncbi:unnamed protein product [Mytilus coruscus]|uniref:Uncharacterized protein n=1 Tax=Mytilus coruscus TaxID=42192 RepID=A0A6J8AI53_MYTCO|nr:unnamed protein product [Mytilus coruscus]